MIIGIDFDGTLVSCRDKQVECLRAGTYGYGNHIKWDELWAAKRMGENNTGALRLQHVPEDVITEAANFWSTNIESKKFLDFDQLFPFTRDFLQQMSTDHALFLISARMREDNLRAQICDLRLGDYFKGIEVVPGSNVGQAKAEAFERLGVECYVGDTEVDWMAAVASDVIPLILCTGQRAHPFLVDYGVYPVHLSLQEVAESVNALQRQ